MWKGYHLSKVVNKRVGPRGVASPVENFVEYPCPPPIEVQALVTVFRPQTPWSPSRSWSSLKRLILHYQTNLAAAQSRLLSHWYGRIYLVSELSMCGPNHIAMQICLVVMQPAQSFGHLAILQLNLFTMATLGTEKNCRCREVAFAERWPLVEVRLHLMS